MKIIKKIAKIIVLVLVLCIGVILVQYLLHGNPASENIKFDYEIVAHRGVHSQYKKGTYNVRDGCEASHIFHPQHDYIENTIKSIAAAFAYGATIVEIDIRRTADSNFVVFHDYSLECRTDGTGLIKEYNIEYLKTLDIGFGYTADSGITYPFRGKGVGLIPTLDEVLSEFPNKKFLIDHKDADEKSTSILIDILRKYPKEQRSQLFLWSRPSCLKTIQTDFPEIKPLLLNRREMKDHVLPFFLSFGLIELPKEWEGRVMCIPVKYTKYVWGWPYRFINLVHNSGIKVYISGINIEDAEKYNSYPVDGFVTDYIELTGSVLKNSK